MKKLLIICGPTGVGKTALAVKLAKKLNGELVNADSRQVYRGMNIGTGKDIPVGLEFKTKSLAPELKKEKYQIGYYLVSGVPIWLLDLVWPDYRFSVADYLKVAVPVINNIWERRKLPILVGGTGFYLKALTEGVETIGVKPNQDLRKKLDQLSLLELQQKLNKLDVARFNKMNNSDKHNPRRLIRAIEVAISKKTDQVKKTEHLFLAKENIIWIGLKAPLSKLEQRINQRINNRLKLGLKEEIERLLGKYSFEHSALGQTIAYQEWEEYFFSPENKKKKALQGVLDRWRKNESQYARRQITWFKKNKAINWFMAQEEGLVSKVARKIN